MESHKKFDTPHDHILKINFFHFIKGGWKISDGLRTVEFNPTAWRLIILISYTHKDTQEGSAVKLQGELKILSHPNTHLLQRWVYTNTLLCWTPCSIYDLYKKYCLSCYLIGSWHYTLLDLSLTTVKKGKITKRTKLAKIGKNLKWKNW